MSKQVIANSGNVNGEIVEKTNTNFTELYGNDIQVQGDSLVDQDFTQYLNPLLNGRVSTNHGTSGKTSSWLRDDFIANADFTKAQIFLIGRNNPTYPSVIIDDLRTMISYLTHTNFLILNPPNGGSYLEFGNLETGVKYDSFIELETRLAAEYPSNFINLRKAVINGWKMGDVRLLTSFTQPAIGANIQVNVSDAAFLNNQNAADYVAPVTKLWIDQVRIGNVKAADLYDIVSVDDSTHITLTLTEANVIAEGGLVENITYFDGAIGKIQIMQELDWQCYQADTSLSTAREDALHFKYPDGRIMVAEIIAKFINSRFI